MQPWLRTALCAVGACLLAVWVGITVAEERLWLATLVALASLWIVLSWTTAPRAEAWLLSFVFIGYVLGNRGFAQITPVYGLPLFFSELGLVGAGALITLRGALLRELPVRRDPLNLLLLLWIALAAGRMTWDFRVHGLTAVRDFATVYYVFYFFAAQTLAAHAPSRAILRGGIAVAFAVLPFTAVLADAFPELFLSYLTINGTPLIYYKDDLLATFLFAGFVFFVPKSPLPLSAAWWRWLLALAALVIGLMELSRAAMVGLGVALIGLALARRWLPLKALAVTCAAAVLVASLLALVRREDFTQSRIYGVYEHVIAITDFSGTRHYANAASLDSGDNNRFRLIWWRTLSEETLAQSPVFGLGFGHDLARGFVQEYYAGSSDEFTARSPHSIIFTAFGRMGFVGLAAFLAIMITIAAASLHTASRTAAGSLDDDAVTLYAMAWVVLTSACFGVVLEGPMGAIPFWTILGLAYAAPAATAESKDHEQPARDLRNTEPSGTPTSSP